MAHNSVHYPLRGCDLLNVYRQSFIDNYPLPAITDYNTSRTLTYGDLGRRILRYHIFFEEAGIVPGDKVALLGRNNAEWIIAFMATITYGAVIVPILHDFNPNDAQHIINHSDSKLLFVNDSIWEHLEHERLPKVMGVISLDNRKLLSEQPGKTPKPISKILKSITRTFGRRFPDFGRDDISFEPRANGDVAIINYTSGTTGFSKGVMLTYDNLAGNIEYGIHSRLHYQGSRALSFLPLAHAYGCAFDMLVPLAVGSHITVLGRTPTPSLLIKAMADVRPNLVICVPLILEKIYRKMIVPMITKTPMRWALAIPMLDRAIYSRIRARLVEAFGGNFEEVIVGGAPLNPEVEDFLYKLKFPFTVGYGMTECGPLISHTPWRQFIPGSAGRTLKGIMTAEIVPDERNPDIGEIVVKGQNVMKGYYKNPEATEAVLDADGSLHTGDMGHLGGPDGQTVFIKGRYKTMILTANGQNIYPEEIEAKLNNMPYVAESLVVERGPSLVGLVYPDREEIDRSGIDESQLRKVMDNNLADLNNLLAPYEQLAKIDLMDEEFQKTPKRSIKRFLYK